MYRETPHNGVTVSCVCNTKLSGWDGGGHWVGTEWGASCYERLQHSLFIWNYATAVQRH
jgi:hypothetical protein